MAYYIENGERGCSARLILTSMSFWLTSCKPLPCIQVTYVEFCSLSLLYLLQDTDFYLSCLLSVCPVILLEPARSRKLGSFGNILKKVQVSQERDGLGRSRELNPSRSLCPTLAPLDIQLRRMFCLTLTSGDVREGSLKLSYKQ